jgi:hypothetical protein
LVSDIQVASGIHRHTVRLIQAGVGGRATVSSITPTVRARHCGDDTIGVHLADAAVEGISDVKVSEAIQRYGIWPICVSRIVPTWITKIIGDCNAGWHEDSVWTRQRVVYIERA